MRADFASSTYSALYPTREPYGLFPLPPFTRPPLFTLNLHCKRWPFRWFFTVCADAKPASFSACTAAFRDSLFSPPQSPCFSLTSSSPPWIARDIGDQFLTPSVVPLPPVSRGRPLLSLTLRLPRSCLNVQRFLCWEYSVFFRDHEASSSFPPPLILFSQSASDSLLKVPRPRPSLS